MKRKSNIETEFGMLTQLHNMITAAMSFYKDHLLLLRPLRVGKRPKVPAGTTGLLMTAISSDTTI